MKTLIPWAAAIGISGFIGAAAVVLVDTSPEARRAEAIRQAKEFNEEAAFEHVYSHDTGHHELVEETIRQMLDVPAKYRPGPEQVAAFRERMKRVYRERWEQERRSSGPESR